MPTKKLIVSITGRVKKDWQNKLKEIEKYRIKKIGLFLEVFSRRERAGLLEAFKIRVLKNTTGTHRE